VARVWDLHAPVGVEPMVLRIPPVENINSISFDPTRRWMVTGVIQGAAFWPIPDPSAVVFSDFEVDLWGGRFTPDGSEIVFGEPGVGIWVLPTTPGAPRRLVPLKAINDGAPTLDPEGRFVIARSVDASVLVVPLDGSPPTRLEGFDPSARPTALAYDPARELVAAAPHLGPKDKKVIRVWSLRDGSVTVLGPADDAAEGFEGGYRSLAFLPDGSLLSISKGSLRRWNLDDGSSEIVVQGSFHHFRLSPDRSTIGTAYFGDQTVHLIDLDTGEIQRLPEYGEELWSFAFGPEPRVIASGSQDGTIRVGRLGGGAPHHLFGHTGTVGLLEFSPDGRWLLSGDRAGTIRLWPAPDLSRPAPHTLPLDEYLAKLDEFTNVRFVRDEESPTGWSGHRAPFPGWAEVPSW
jgi:WD40 repeat protein